MDSARFEFSPEADAGIWKFGFKAREHFAKPIERRAQRLAPRGPVDDPHSGHLARSIETEAEFDEHYIGSNEDYAAAQELGARPHMIPGAFGRVGAVHHPGNRAQPYLRPALYIQTLIEEAGF